MARIAIKSAFIADQFEVRHYTGDDGYPTAQVFSPVCVQAADGNEYWLPIGERCEDYCDEETGEWFDAYGYRERYDANEMVEKVERRGFIDPDHWVKLEERPSLEEELGPYGLAWQAEQEDRRMWGAA